MNSKNGKTQKTDWTVRGDTICVLLTAVYVEERETFKKEAARRGIGVEQLAAAAIAEIVREIAED